METKKSIPEKDLCIIALSFLLLDWKHPGTIVWNNPEHNDNDRTTFATFIVDGMLLSGYNYATINEICKIYDVPFDYIGDDLEVDKDVVDVLSTDDKLVQHINNYFSYMQYGLYTYSVS